MPCASFPVLGYFYCVMRASQLRVLLNLNKWNTPLFFFVTPSSSSAATSLSLSLDGCVISVGHKLEWIPQWQCLCRLCAAHCQKVIRRSVVVMNGMCSWCPCGQSLYTECRNTTIQARRIMTESHYTHFWFVWGWCARVTISCIRTTHAAAVVSCDVFVCLWCCRNAMSTKTIAVEPTRNFSGNAEEFCCLTLCRKCYAAALWVHVYFNYTFTTVVVVVVIRVLREARILFILRNSIFEISRDKSIFNSASLRTHRFTNTPIVSNTIFFVVHWLKNHFNFD